MKDVSKVLKIQFSNFLVWNLIIKRDKPQYLINNQGNWMDIVTDILLVLNLQAKFGLQTPHVFFQLQTTFNTVF